MNLDKDLLLQIAKNARLNLTEEEIEEFLPQLSEVLDVFSKLSDVKTDNVKPSFHPIPIENVMRDDKVENSLSAQEVFQDVKNKENNFFKGPKAI